MYKPHTGPPGPHSRAQWLSWLGTSTKGSFGNVGGRFGYFDVWSATHIFQDESGMPEGEAPWAPSTTRPCSCGSELSPDLALPHTSHQSSAGLVESHSDSFRGQLHRHRRKPPRAFQSPSPFQRGTPLPQQWALGSAGHTVMVTSAVLPSHRTWGPAWALPRVLWGAYTRTPPSAPRLPAYPPARCRALSADLSKGTFQSRWNDQGLDLVMMQIYS